MQQGDQTVLSLRPGGGRGSRLLAPRFDSSSSSASSASPAFGSFSSNLALLRPHIKVSIPFLWICFSTLCFQKSDCFILMLCVIVCVVMELEWFYSQITRFFFALFVNRLHELIIFDLGINLINITRLNLLMLDSFLIFKLKFEVWGLMLTFEFGINLCSPVSVYSHSGFFLMGFCFV